MGTYCADRLTCTNIVLILGQVKVNQPTSTIHGDHNVHDADVPVNDPSIIQVLYC